MKKPATLGVRLAGFLGRRDCAVGGLASAGEIGEHVEALRGKVAKFRCAYFTQVKCTQSQAKNIVDHSLGVR